MAMAAENQGALAPPIDKPSHRSTERDEGSGRTAERIRAGRRPRKRPEASRGDARRSAPIAAPFRAPAA